MKKIFLALLALFLSQGQAQKLEKSLLWKITGNGIREASYLYGTIHISCDATLPQKVKDAMGNTNQLYLELDMDDDSMQMQMMGKVMMKDGMTLEKLSTPEDFALVDDFLKKNLGFSAKALNTIKPAMVSMMLYPKMIDCEVQSVENELMKISKEQNEPVFGLESVADQMKVFDEIPYKEQMDELVKTAKNDLKKDKAELDQLMAVYKTGDLDAMVKLSKESENVMTSKYDDVLLNDRNSNWIAKIIAVAKENPTFFGVGAAHLGGEKGVINLLRKQGYKVEAVF